MNEVEVYDTGIYDSSEISYQGDGILTAVLDTGFDRSHPAFREMPEVQKLTKSDVASELPSLAAATHGESISVNDVYYNAKVPFAYDYADGDPDVFPKTSSHGLHVAGIIAGKDESVTAEDAEAFENGETFIGVAPNAQLMICKVFPDQEDGTEGGAETDDILAALSDCIALNVDVINMSLGVAAGFSREEDGNAINAVYDSIYEAGINLVVAASNDGSAAQNGAYGTTNLTSNPDSATVGSPSTYTSSLSVASISGQLSSYMQLEDGTAVYFNESSNAAGIHGDFVAELLDGRSEATFNFVVVPGYGYDYNYTADVQNISDEEWSALYGELPVREQDLTKPIDIYNCLDDCKHTKWGAKFCKLIMKMMGGDEDEAPKEGENAGQANMMKAMALQIPIRNFIAMSMGVMSEKMANGLLDILNDDRSTFKGFMRILGGIPGAIPKLGPLLKSI